MDDERPVSTSALVRSSIPPNIEWGIRDRRSHRSRRYVGRIASALAWLLCGVVALGIYMNVVTDDSALRERTDGLARQRAGCGSTCHVLHMEGRRSVFEYRADYEFAGKGSVHVTCRRGAIVLGDHDCEAR